MWAILPAAGLIVLVALLLPRPRCRWLTGNGSPAEARPRRRRPAAS